jgi:hypothetical protein
MGICRIFESNSGYAMSARITVNLAASGVFEIWLNEQGRDLLVKELQNLSEKWDHFHLGPADTGEVVVSSRPYRPDDTVFECGKVYLRPDAWDKQYFPHVLDAKA